MSKKTESRMQRVVSTDHRARRGEEQGTETRANRKKQRAKTKCDVQRAESKEPRTECKKPMAKSRKK